MTVLPAQLPSIADAQLPERYEAAKTALAECYRIDECKDWADKAQAMASYAKQADDDTLYKTAIRIKSRAIRRCGQLMKEYQAPGARTDRPSGDAPTRLTQRAAAEEAGMSKDQEVMASRVANVPEAEFDAAVESDDPPSITQLAEMGRRKHDTLTRPRPPGFHAATELQGTTDRFDQFCGEHDPKVVAEGFLLHEIEPTRQQIAVISDWLGRFTVHLTEVEHELSQQIDPRNHPSS